MIFVDTLEKHRKQPHISLMEYTQGLRLQLGKEIKNIKKIYLDTNYWIELCDAALCRSRKDNFINLLELLRKTVKSGKIICPISDENFYEILLQSDPTTLIASIKIIDELSRGVALLSTEERTQFEILYFIRSTTRVKEAVYQPDEFIWSKVSFIYGTQHPYLPHLSSEEQLIMQKAFFDQMWSMSISDMIDVMGIDKIATMPKYTDISVRLNRDKVKYAHENRSFKQLFLSEIAGVVDLHKPLFEEAMIYLFEKEYGYKPILEEITKTDAGKSIANAIYNLFERNKLGAYFPSLIIGAGLYAAVRQDIQRKLAPNDMSDFRHAQAALPYFDYFFTDNSLRDLITRSNIRFDKKYDCVVESYPDKVISLITQIYNS